MLKIMSLLLLFANLFNCSTPKKTETYPFSADVLIKKDGEKLTAQFMFYAPISEILNGKENRGFGKSPLIVDFPKINGVAMKEVKTSETTKMYLAEIESAEKDYTVTFMRKDGEYQGVFRATESDLGKTITVQFKK